METIVQFLMRNDQFMARGQRHTVKWAFRLGEQQQVLVVGERADGHYFEATFNWGDIVDTLTPDAATL